ncbi:DUF1799 domain-containing protein [Diaphorobacter sp. HDW4B]|uniref:DUF1799 domain-containing protein n=1 Tax=Diaphorobacter sp. HDW4B TaxID=2714925 RepID=UPI001F10CB63|nr:DUF1799 domain-containing protein [Diaphorobacter sp. HDW4B]
MTEREAQSEGFELEDYETEEIEVWDDNLHALGLFRIIGTRWVYPSMGGGPIGLRWEAIYPLMDKLGLDADEWNDLHESLMVLEVEAVSTIAEFAPKPKSGK